MDDYAWVRGFNYQPGWGSTSLENWLYYDKNKAKAELMNGKKYFPKMNAVRLWLSWDAYARKEDVFKMHFEEALEIADELGLKVIPCLLNRWHSGEGYDNGGVYVDNFAFPTSWSYFREHYRKYVEDIVSTHINDARILIWDLVNEPYSYNAETPELKPFIEIETGWLKELYDTVKSTGTPIPAGISVHGGQPYPLLDRVEPYSDVLLIHPYFAPVPETLYDEGLRQQYEDGVRAFSEYAKKVGKPVLVTETCWGTDHDDEARAEIIRFSLSTLKKYHMGFLPHALCYSLVSDLHESEDGNITHSGNLAFLNKDGTLRPGHEVFNEF